MNLTHGTVGMACWLLLTSVGWAEEWPCWRGPRGDGVSGESNIPTRWSATENVRWKSPIPGTGHSSPIVWGDKVFVTTCIEEGLKRELLCLDRRDGKLLWERTVLTAPLEKKNNLNSYASSTPATDGKHVWVSFLEAPNIRVVCYDLDGNEVWRKSPGTFQSKHGFCSSVVPYKETIILNCDQDDVAYIVAFDKATGTERWRTDRPNRTRSYCVPTIFQAAGKSQMVLSGSKCVASYDPDSGKQHWLIDGPTEQFVASVVYTDDTFFVTGGFPQLHLIGIRPDGVGNVTQSHVIWHDTHGVSYVPSPIAQEKWFFLVADGGDASCYEAKTGQRMWKQKLGKHHSASPVAAGGNLYFTDDDGQTFVFKAGPAFELIATNPLEEKCFASPAISRGELFIRSEKSLFCIGSNRQ